MSRQSVNTDTAIHAEHLVTVVAWQCLDNVYQFKN